MLCSIYQRTYHLKRKYQPNTFYTDSLDEEHWYFVKLSYLKAHDRPEYWCFTPWKEIVVNFNPESIYDIKWYKGHIVEMCRNIKYVQFATREDEIPSHYFCDTSVVQFKVVDEDRNIIDMRPYIENYFYQKERKYNERQNCKKQRYPSLQHYLRHPQTTNEKKQALSKEEKRYYQQKGWHIKERSKRNKRNLPNLFDDKPIHVDKCWKSHTRQPKQYLRNKKAKRKRIHGEEYKNPARWET